MSIMFEVLYAAPPDLVRESRITEILKEFGGRLTFREEPEKDNISQAVVLTYEFADCPSAEAAATRMYDLGEHVEGLSDYGDD